MPIRSACVCVRACVCVVQVKGREIPIVHRVMKLHQERGTAAIKFLTKGDNNQVDDRGLYAPGQIWLEPSDVVGRARAFVPKVGIVTILMNDYPQFKVGQCLVRGFSESRTLPCVWVGVWVRVFRSVSLVWVDVGVDAWV